MNLQQLDHLLALAETGSFSRASEKVHLTQPALSRSIQMLEQELGMPLVDRIGKRNELTPFGAMVLRAPSAFRWKRTSSSAPPRCWPTGRPARCGWGSARRRGRCSRRRC
ncbi:LysR family transcriptional regulator [Variovorax sp. E3]|uniref:LysR family transcriptional regulator n=1 Tax=Variovorax sp. E3 TaxID=1914993 RepID=UPI0027DC4B6B|nr:LysR family transcriptional regulator [Variovorax sp. E3]